MVERVLSKNTSPQHLFYVFWCMQFMTATLHLLVKSARKNNFS
ncbi:hypothetical protein COO91_04423 [Nostoc flagelliforme CCNUN1]|uniref:Uncharacterized protein n=1 Tax=Nostoc flagelliforme CCNUN1 TaxID=2038116 RepID=A0A2K8ST10_9NOSO|nr:hypothetical protein COO91_04423 [Nostoc flagelliforme CCNUN1]